LKEKRGPNQKKGVLGTSFKTQREAQRSQNRWKTKRVLFRDKGWGINASLGKKKIQTGRTPSKRKATARVLGTLETGQDKGRTCKGGQETEKVELGGKEENPNPKRSLAAG